MLDLLAQLQCPTVVVSRNYLGSINHTLLTLEILKARKIPVAGVIFNGEPNAETEQFILNYSGVSRLLSIPFLETVDRKEIAELAQKIRPNLISQL